MKLLILSCLFLVGCSTMERQVPTFYDQKKLNCIKELIGNHGVEAQKAADICERVYRRDK